MAVVSVGPFIGLLVKQIAAMRHQVSTQQAYLWFRGTIPHTKRHRFGVRQVLQALVAEGTAKVSLMLEAEMKRISWNWVYSTNEFVTPTGAYERVSRIIGQNRVDMHYGS